MGERRNGAAVFAVILALTTVSAWGQETIDPDGDGSQYAWSENTGWINAEPGGDGQFGIRIEIPHVTGWLWGENVGWISLSCATTASCGLVDYGVELLGTGAFTGWAWAENVGWISFSCENTGSCATADYGVFVDFATGELSGRAWSENVGWIGFSCADTASCGTVDWGVRTSTPIQGKVIFGDGFESNGTGNWSLTRN